MLPVLPSVVRAAVLLRVSGDVTGRSAVGDVLVRWLVAAHYLTALQLLHVVGTGYKRSNIHHLFIVSTAGNVTGL